MFFGILSCSTSRRSLRDSMSTAHPNNSYPATPTSSGSRRCAAVGVRSVTQVTRHGVHLGGPFDHHPRLGRAKARHSSAFSRLSVHAELVVVAPLCLTSRRPVIQVTRHDRHSGLAPDHRTRLDLAKARHSLNSNNSNPGPHLTRRSTRTQPLRSAKLP